MHQREIVLDHLDNIRTQHFDGDLCAGFGADAVRQLREMDLRDRRACDGHGVECFEDLIERLLVDACQRRDDLFRRERRHGILQLGELVGDVGRQ